MDVITPATVFGVVGYATCSSLMLIINKIAVHVLPAPAFVLIMQFIASWTAVKLCGLAGLIEVDALERSKLLAFLPVSVAFLACVYANIKTLQYANVETFIIFRASTPLCVSLCEFLFLGRELPNARSTLCLLVLLGGASLYVYTDATFIVNGYAWVAIWYVIFCVDQVYIKHAVDTVKVQSNWGRVFYTNLWASLLCTLISAATEPQLLQAFDWNWSSVLALTISCLLGVAMSYFAFLCRSQVSAASFTVLGNVCKILTVFINVLIWDKHASSVGLACLCVCLVAAFFYQQAPKRLPEADAEEKETGSLMREPGELDRAEEELESSDPPSRR